jgi:metal-responsive CopG/Arc/MetJ family transcriptional regulator
LLGGAILASLFDVTVPVDLPDELVARIDDVAEDRAAFIVEAVRNLLRESETTTDATELERINAAADDLNREAEDVLEYQVIA